MSQYSTLSLGVYISHARVVGLFYLQIRKHIIEVSEAGRAARGAEGLPSISAPENALERDHALPHSVEDAAWRVDQGGAFQAFVWGVFTNTARITHRLFARLLCSCPTYKQLQDVLERAVAEELQGSEDALLEAYSRAIVGPRFGPLD